MSAYRLEILHCDGIYIQFYNLVINSAFYLGLSDGMASDG